MAWTEKYAELGLRTYQMNGCIYHHIAIFLSPSFFAFLLDLAVKIITISISTKNQTKQQNVDTLCRGKCSAALWPLCMWHLANVHVRWLHWQLQGHSSSPAALPSPLTVHSEVIDGSWACQLLDRLLYPLHSAVFILFAHWQFKQIRATFLLFCWHFAAAHTAQSDRETVQPNGRQKTRPRLLPRVVHVVQFDATPGRKRCIDSTNKNNNNNNATQQFRNVCLTCCTTPDPLLLTPPPSLFGLQIKIQHMLFN